MGISRLSFRHPARVPVRRRRLALGLAAVLGLGGLVETSVANTLTVTTCNDQYDPLNPRATWLRQQVAAASSGDTIDLTSLTCSTITLTHGAIPVSVANLEIDGPTGHTLTIDGNLQDRVFYQTASGGQLLLENLHIMRGASSGDGGCIFSDGTVHLFANVTVTGCYAVGAGGGIAAPYVQTNSSTIADNSGGGILAFGTRTSTPDAYLQNTTVSGNTGGAGLRGNPAGYLKISTSTIENNTLGSNGTSQCGGIDASTYTTSLVKLSYSNVVGNNGGTTHTGGICAGAVQLFHATVSGNKGGVGGIESQSTKGSGVLYDFYAQASTIGNNTGYIATAGVNAFSALVNSSTISGNQSAGAAGGIGARNLIMTNSTVSGNRGQGAGGISVLTLAKIYNSTIAFNADSDAGYNCGAGINGGYISSSPYSPSYLANFSIKSTIVAKNVCGNLNAESDVTAVNGSMLTASGSLIMASSMPSSSITADPQLLPLANNGGSVQTHALDSHSPALGVGSNPKGLGTDERGYPFQRTWVNGQVDIGAFQTQDRIFYNGFE